MRPRFTLLAILVVATALRLWGLGWGLPNATHTASYHPDEWNTLRSLGNMRPAASDFNPRYFDNPTLYYYAVGALARGGERLHLYSAPLARDTLREHPADLARLYLVGRGLSAALGVLTVLLVYFLGRSLAGPAAGLVAALLMAVAPGPVVLAHFMDVDVTMVFFATAALLAAMRAVVKPSPGTTLAAGLLSGLAASTKYNGVLVVVVIAAGLLFAKGKGRLGRVALHLAAAAAGFVLGTPYAVLAPREFLAGARYVLLDRAGGHWTGLGHGLDFPATHTWRWGLGLAILVLYALGFLWGLVRPTRPALVLAAFVLLVYATLALTGTDYLRYGLPAFPALAALAGRVLGPWADSKRALVRLPAVFFVIAVALHGVALSLAWDLVMATKDVRDQASVWLAGHAPEGAVVAVPREPFFHSPGLVHTQFWYNRPGSTHAVPSRLRVVNVEGSVDALGESGSGLVVLSEYEVLYPTAAGSREEALLAHVLDGGAWREVARFESRPALLGWLLEDPFPRPGWKYTAAAARVLADHGPPHDMKYVNPTVLVYESRDAGP